MRLIYLGFSLIELMIVVAIIGILATISLPSYFSYTQRARFAEVITITEPFKTAISLALQEGAPLNELTHDQHGIPIAPAPTKNLSSLTVSQGIITAKSTKAAGDATYILKPSQDGNAWTIEGTCFKAGLCNS